MRVSSYAQSCIMANGFLEFSCKYVYMTTRRDEPGVGGAQSLVVGFPEIQKSDPARKHGSEGADRPPSVPRWQVGRSLYQGSLPHSWCTRALYALPISAARRLAVPFLLKSSRYSSGSHARQEEQR